MRRTSEMMYPLEAPNGWFLLKMEHQHTGIKYKGDQHLPVDHPEGPWYVEFQVYPYGGRMVSGRGHTMELAWKAASDAAIFESLQMMSEKRS